MGELVDHAKAVADLLVTAGAKATHNVRNAVPPCILVVPVPRLDYDVLSGGASATFTAVAIASGPGDLKDAEFLESAVALIASVVDLTTAEPGAYVLPNQADPKPAYLCTFQVDAS